jgi:DNA-binding NarL/FixJ family response regulator
MRNARNSAGVGKPVHSNIRVSVPPRAREVLNLLTQGWTNAMIGHALNIRVQTVKNYIRWWCKQTGASGPHARIDLVLQYALLVEEAGASDNVAADKAWASLTERQKTIEALLVCNLSHKTITECTGINSHSMRDLLSGDSGIYAKIGVSDRLELVVWHIAHRFAEWWWNEPSPCPFPNSKEYVLIAVPDFRQRPPVAIHDRGAMLKGTTKSSRRDSGSVTLITENADLCRVMGITADLFPSGLQARS